MLYQHVCVRNYHGSQCLLKKTCEVEGMFANSIITVVVAAIIGGGGWISHFAQVYSASVYSCFLFSYSSPTAHSPLAPEQLPFPRLCLFVL